MEDYGIRGSIMDEKIKKYLENTIMVFLITIFSIIVFTCLDFFLAIFVQMAWNNTLTDLFGIKEISYWQSFWLLFGLSVLWKITPIPYERK